jgi:hypothetical protein
VSIVKPHAIEKFAAELTGYGVDIARQKQHADSCVSVDGYALFRRDGARRKCGGIAAYIRQSSIAVVYKPPVAGNNPDFDILWFKVKQSGDATFIGALYQPPSPIYEMTHLLDYIEATVLRMQQDFPGCAPQISR